MTTYKIAHLHEQGQDMIIVPLDGSFGSKSSSDQQEFLTAFEYAAHQAGLAGTAVTIWQSGRTVRFIAPSAWHPFFRSPNIWRLVTGNLNKTLTF
ncbi:hypothetical protein HX875_03960 [Pseudomonas yamanorum]|nr:hypothetical protein [Pseudomonas yamanorum]